jgi:SAM-dependent methyltransferase
MLHEVACRAANFGCSRPFPAAKDMTSVDDAARKQRFIASEQFYLDEARRRDGRVLELGCGSGRLTLRIAQNGIDTVGADLSGSMLEAAQAKALAGQHHRSFTLDHPKLGEITVPDFGWKPATANLRASRLRLPAPGI